MSDVQNAAAVKSKVVKLNSPSLRFEIAEFKRTIYLATPEAGVTLEQIQKPEFWAHVSHRLKAMDRLEVQPEDNSYFAELLVLSASRISANVKLLRHVDLGGVVVEPDDAADCGMEVKWAGGVAKFRVIRKSDNVKVRDGFETKAAATEWMHEHAKALAA